MYECGKMSEVLWLNEMVMLLTSKNEGKRQSQGEVEALSVII